MVNLYFLVLDVSLLANCFISRKALVSIRDNSVVKIMKEAADISKNSISNKLIINNRKLPIALRLYNSDNSISLQPGHELIPKHLQIIVIGEVFPILRCVFDFKN